MSTTNTHDAMIQTLWRRADNREAKASVALRPFPCSRITLESSPLLAVKVDPTFLHRRDTLTWAMKKKISAVSDHRVPHLRSLYPLVGYHRPAHIQVYSSQTAFAHLGYPAIAYSPWVERYRCTYPCDHLLSA